MKQHFQKIILDATQAEELYSIEMVQSLWSGYGQITRYGLIGCDTKTVIVKHVSPPNQGNHPRGWNTDLSHQRKLTSYQVETAWYKNWNQQCDAHCRTPQCLALETQGDEVLMVLEDLDGAGFPSRKHSVNSSEINACLKWLAHFHATFMQEQPTGLWPIGTYWHLDTRPDELDALQDAPLKNAAKAIDQALNNSAFLTFVHGDAKLANFCFSDDGQQVSAVDFQYIGGGCGMKDVAYFLGSCLSDDECERQKDQLLDVYFTALKTALSQQQKNLDFVALEKDWRTLYPVAWTDFHRFLQGWSPGHWKINRYSKRLTQQVLAQL